MARVLFLFAWPPGDISGRGPPPLPSPFRLPHPGPSCCYPLLRTGGSSVVDTSLAPTWVYSPNHVEGKFSELRLYGVLGSSFALPTHVHFAHKRKEDDQEMSVGSESTEEKRPARLEFLYRPPLGSRLFDTSELHVDFLQSICSCSFQERVECAVSELIVGGWYCSLDVPYESPVRSRAVTIELSVEWCPATLKPSSA